jgi:hypothetical protein
MRYLLRREYIFEMCEHVHRVQKHLIFILAAVLVVDIVVKQLQLFSFFARRW